MKTIYSKKENLNFKNHPKFEGVKIALLVSSKECPDSSVCILKIEDGVEIPVHTHEKQADSIYIVSGKGDFWFNGKWQSATSGDHIFVPAQEEHSVRNTGTEILQIFVHHCPALL